MELCQGTYRSETKGDGLSSTSNTGIDLVNSALQCRILLRQVANQCCNGKWGWFARDVRCANHLTIQRDLVACGYMAVRGDLVVNARLYPGPGGGDLYRRGGESCANDKGSHFATVFLDMGILDIDVTTTGVTQCVADQSFIFEAVGTNA